MPITYLVLWSIVAVESCPDSWLAPLLWCFLAAPMGACWAAGCEPGIQNWFWQRLLGMWWTRIFWNISSDKFCLEKTSCLSIWGGIIRSHPLWPREFLLSPGHWSSWGSQPRMSSARAERLQRAFEDGEVRLQKTSSFRNLWTLQWQLWFGSADLMGP